MTESDAVEKCKLTSVTKFVKKCENGNNVETNGNGGRKSGGSNACKLS